MNRFFFGIYLFSLFFLEPKLYGEPQVESLFCLFLNSRYAYLLGIENQDFMPVLVQEKLNGYGEYQFGLSFQSVKKLLMEDSQFFYDGDEDVTLLRPKDNTVISVLGRNSFKSAFFVFNESTLYEIILEINSQFLDYFSLYTQLIEKYGDPSNLNPQRVKWEFENAFLILERPLLVKYIDKSVLKKVDDRLEGKNNINDQYRKKLLDQL